ncbi:unnamed protein product [Gongylonema pulchrum]|uniref:Mic1 domain-containing protein n=1 Tax=Gongylonema pulchrum TaxID=637853 RepID=A0A183CXN3_9BILA|nr:unnamed protein product [Gongylonema pulchrum]
MVVVPESSVNSSVKDSYYSYRDANAQCFDESASVSSSAGSSTSKNCIVSVLDAPPGPFSALDISPDGKIVCYDEKLNRIVQIDFRTEDRIFHVIPSCLNFERFYWSHIVAVQNTVLLALLKSHRSCAFYLVSFLLQPDRPDALEVQRIRTKIFTDGYEVNFRLRRLSGFWAYQVS